MRERDHYQMAISAAEAMYHLWELEAQQAEPNLDAMFQRLRDLSAYSLTHAEIMQQREVVELLALAIFFGATSNRHFQSNQRRIALLSPDAISYQGQAHNIEEEVKHRNSMKISKDPANRNIPYQRRLL